MWAHLWTKSVNAPQDYVELVLCRDVYKCPPDVLERQSLIKIFTHLKVMEIEAKVDELRNPKKKKKTLNAKLPT